MTTLAIIGGGIAGRSLIYALATLKKTYSEILLFESDDFAHTCSLRSTAVVAPRGVTRGHSALGDLLMDGFATFSQHVAESHPEGITPITQFTGALTKLDQFKARYPESKLRKDLGELKLKSEIEFATEEAYLLETQTYLKWLTRAAPVKIVNEFVTKVEGLRLTTLNGSEFEFDHLVFAGGVHNQLWGFRTPARRVQGAYYEFKGADFGERSFSVTLEGDNLIYHAHSRILLIGSTSLEILHEWPQTQALEKIYRRLEALIDLRLPDLKQGTIITGLREKAPKRAPYLVTEGSYSRIGGFYKNGFSLGLHLGKQLAADLQFPTKEK